MAHDEKKSLLRRLDAKTVTITLAAELASLPPALEPFSAELAAPNAITVHYPPSRMHIGEILDAVRNAGLDIVDLSTEETDLEDIFLQLTRGEESDAA